MTLTPLGDSAVVVALGSVLDDATLRRVGRLAKVLEHDRLVGVVDVVPAFASVTVFYDASQSGGYEHLCAQIAARAQRTEMDEIGGETRMMEIPVCYGGARIIQVGAVDCVVDAAFDRAGRCIGSEGGGIRSEDQA
ncbi:MAG: hypothetical protein CK548_08285 [Opitutia bacterium]|nr:MAG: hypothetical protein CK548_08285 [Opitutae bacterium]